MRDAPGLGLFFLFVVLLFILLLITLFLRLTWIAGRELGDLHRKDNLRLIEAVRRKVLRRVLDELDDAGLAGNSSELSGRIAISSAADRLFDHPFPIVLHKL